MIFNSQVIIPLIKLLSQQINACCILGTRLSIRLDELKSSFIPSLNSNLLQTQCQLNY